MFAYFAVYMYDGVIHEVRAFTTIEAARKYFHEGIEANGKVEDCEPLWYSDGEEDFFYWTNLETCERCSEIRIWKVEIE